MNRAERRRMQKQKGKSYLAPPMNSVSNYTIEQISKATGTKIESLMYWKEAREKEMFDGFQKEAQEKLWKAEDYIAVANILISVYAIKMSRKNREHTKDLIQRMISNMNPAREYIERVGIQKAYEYVKKDFDIELEFDSIDINKEFGFGDFGDKAK